MFDSAKNKIGYWLKNKHYKSYRRLMWAWVLLELIGQDEDVYPAENINFSYGYSYFLFAERKTWCVMCFCVVKNGGWKHPDELEQDIFEDLASEFFEDNYPFTTPAACSESCWQEFMRLSYEHWEVL